MSQFKKSNPQANSVYVKPLLSDIAVKIMNDSENFVARKMFTPVQVDQQAGLFHVIEGFLRDQSRPLADNEEFAEGSYQVRQGTYAALEFGESRAITDNARANAQVIDPEVVATQNLAESLMLKMEKSFADVALLTTAAWSNEIDGYAAGPGANPWNATDGNPIADIDELRRQILSKTGRTPNKLLLSYAAYVAIKNNPLVIDRHKYTSKDPIGPQALAALFEVEELLVNKAVIDSAQSGLDATPGFLVGGGSYVDALLTHTSSTPSLEVPTAGAVFDFAKAGDSHMKMVSWDEPNRRRSMVAGSVFFDAKITAPDLGAIAHGMLD